MMPPPLVCRHSPLSGTIQKTTLRRGVNSVQFVLVPFPFTNQAASKKPGQSYKDVKLDPPSYFTPSAP